MKKFYFVLFVAALLSCNERKPQEVNVNFTAVTVSVHSGDTDVDSTRGYDADVKFFKMVDGPAPLRDSVSETTRLFLSNWFNLPAGGFDLDTAVKSRMNEFFEKIAKDFPDTDDCVGCRHFELQILPEEPYQNKSVVSLVYNWSVYEGGAHGNYARYCMVFDKADGSRITYKRLVKDEAKLLAVAEAEFRSSIGMTSDESMYEMYNFKDDKFHLNDNFAFTANGLAFYYNPYDIAPYSAGLIELVLPYDKVSDLINFGR